MNPRLAKLIDVAIVLMVITLVVRHMPTEPSPPDGRAAWISANQSLVAGRFDEAADAYAQVLDLQPSFPQAHLYRGIALYFDGQFDAAAQSFDAAVSTGSDVYAVYWRYLADERSGAGGLEPLRTALAQQRLSLKGWPGRIGAMLLDDATIEEALEASQRGTGRERRGQACEVLYYAGAKRLINGDPEGARALFKHALDTGASDYIEYMAARVELARLEPGR